MSTSAGTESEAQTGGTDGESLRVRISHRAKAPLTHVWEILVSRAGAQALLGEGAVLGTKGDPYHCADGTSGVVRSYHPLEQLRVSWHATADSPPSIVEVGLRQDGDGTMIELSQKHPPVGLDAEDLIRRWSEAVRAVAALAEN
ncbi:MAG: hypothetical protein QG608_1232 [Actinomycetota bacterium]|nr:hypothetical protein [Actinomycetota bacterium]